MEQSQQVLEWQQKARQEGVKEGVKRVLQRRLPPALTAETLQRLESVSDPQELDRWFDAAIAATDVETFQQPIAKGRFQNRTSQPEA